MKSGYELWNSPRQRKSLSNWAMQLPILANSSIEPSYLEVQNVVRELQKTGAIRNDFNNFELNAITWPYLNALYNECIEKTTIVALDAQMDFCHEVNVIRNILIDFKELVNGKTDLKSPLHDTNMEYKVPRVLSVLFTNPRPQFREQFNRFQMIKTKKEFNNMVKCFMNEVEILRLEWVKDVEQTKIELKRRWKPFLDMKFVNDAVNRERSRHLLENHIQLLKLI
jgi:hypothetical protein